MKKIICTILCIQVILQLGVENIGYEVLLQSNLIESTQVELEVDYRGKLYGIIEE